MELKKFYYSNYSLKMFCLLGCLGCLVILSIALVFSGYINATNIMSDVEKISWWFSIMIIAVLLLWLAIISYNSKKLCNHFKQEAIWPPQKIKAAKLPAHSYLILRVINYDPKNYWLIIRGSAHVISETGEQTVQDIFKLLKLPKKSLDKHGIAKPQYLDRLVIESNGAYRLIAKKGK